MPRPEKKKTHADTPVGAKGSRARRGVQAAPPASRRHNAALHAAPPASDGPPEGDRLQKVLAAAGIASRRECEQLILEGRVEVDGRVVTELGARVDRRQQEIRVDGEPLPRPKLQYFAVHKPTGVVSTARDPAGRPRVIDLLPPGIGRMFNVGRLDLASEGLILVTNDGELAHRLTHPKHGVNKIYEVTVAGQPEPDVLSQIKRGVHLAEGYVHAVDVKVKSRKKGSTILEMALDEGRNREIRRLLARLGHKVQRLVRIAVGPVRLGELPRGAVRALSRDEVQKLRSEAAACLAGERRDQPLSGRPRSQHSRRPRGRRGGPLAGIEEGVPNASRQRRPARSKVTTQRRIIGDDSAVAGRPAKEGPPAAKHRRRSTKRGGAGGKPPGGAQPKGRGRTGKERP